MGWACRAAIAIALSCLGVILLTSVNRITEPPSLPVEEEIKTEPANASSSTAPEASIASEPRSTDVAQEGTQRHLGPKQKTKPGQIRVEPPPPSSGVRHKNIIADMPTEISVTEPATTHVDMRALPRAASCSVVPVATSALGLTPHFKLRPTEAIEQLPSLGIVMTRSEFRPPQLVSAFDDVFFAREQEQHFLCTCRDPRAVFACAAGVLRDRGALYRDVTLVDGSEAGLAALKMLHANNLAETRIAVVMSDNGNEANDDMVCNYARGMEAARYFGPASLFRKWIAGMAGNPLKVYSPLAVRIPLHAFPILMTVGHALFAEWADWRVGLLDTLELFRLYDAEMQSEVKVPSVWKRVVDRSVDVSLPHRAGRIIDRLPPVPSEVHNRNGRAVPAQAGWYEVFQAGYNREREARRDRQTRRTAEGTGMLALVRLNAPDQPTRPSSAHYFGALRKAFHTLVVVAPFVLHLKEAIMSNIFCTHPRQQHTMSICAAYVMRTQLAQASDGIVYMHFDAYVVLRPSLTRTPSTTLSRSGTNGLGRQPHLEGSRRWTPGYGGIPSVSQECGGLKHLAPFTLAVRAASPDFFLRLYASPRSGRTRLSKTPLLKRSLMTVLCSAVRPSRT